MSDKKYKDKRLKFERNHEEGEVESTSKSQRSRSTSNSRRQRDDRRKDHLGHLYSHRRRRHSRSKSGSSSLSYQKRNKHHKRHSRSRSKSSHKRRDKYKVDNLRHKSKERSREENRSNKRNKEHKYRTDSIEKNHKKENDHPILQKENQYKPEQICENYNYRTSEITNIQNNKNNLDNSSSPFQENFDLFEENKHNNLSEKRREQRMRIIESIKNKLKEEADVDVEKKREDDISDKNLNVSSICFNKFDSNHFHMTPEQTTKLLRILEEEREIKMKEELKQQNDFNNGQIDDERLKENDEVIETPKTPDMFAETPIDKILENKNKINLPLFESHEDQTGYYTPKLNEMLNDHYQVIGFCGKGIFSNVVKVVGINNNNKEYAIKILRSIDVMLLSGEKERNLLKKFNELDKYDRSNIIRLIDTFDFKRHICMVFDLYDMNLRDLLKSKGNGVGLPLNVVRSYAQQLLFAFDLIHKYKIIHADFKPDNAVVNKAQDTIKLCDFGSALQEDETVITSELVSRFYRPPEIFLGCPYGTKIDIWSLGCTLFELYTGKILFPGRNNNEMIKLILETKGKFSRKILKRAQYSNLYFTESGNFLSLEIDPYTKQEYIKDINISQLPSRDLLSLLKGSKTHLSQSEEKNLLSFRDFLDKCLHLDPNKRLNALDALTHEFIGIMPVVNKISK